MAALLSSIRAKADSFVNHVSDHVFNGRGFIRNSLVGLACALPFASLIRQFQQILIYQWELPGTICQLVAGCLTLSLICSARRHIHQPGKMVEPPPIPSETQKVILVLNDRMDRNLALDEDKYKVRSFLAHSKEQVIAAVQYLKESKLAADHLILNGTLDSSHIQPFQPSEVDSLSSKAHILLTYPYSGNDDDLGENLSLGFPHATIYAPANDPKTTYIFADHNQDPVMLNFSSDHRITTQVIQNGVFKNFPILKEIDAIERSSDRMLKNQLKDYAFHWAKSDRQAYDVCFHYAASNEIWALRILREVEIIRGNHDVAESYLARINEILLPTPLSKPKARLRFT